MIAIKIFPIAQLLVIFTDSGFCYPSSYYNSKKPSRSVYRPSHIPYDYYPRTQRYPYDYYPYSAQAYPDDYFYNQDAYPMYYLSTRPSTYDMYQAGLPYYYQEAPVPKNRHTHYNSADATLDDQERLLQEIEREQRERSQPIGHEIRYESDYSNDDTDIDETNAAFLNNLMMQQMYQDTVKQRLPSSYYDQYPYFQYPISDEADINVPAWDDMPYDRPIKLEDEEVKELKELPKKPKQRNNKQRKQRKSKIIDNINNDNPSKRSDRNIVYTDRKPIVKEEPSNKVSEEGNKREARGQKEEVLMRPATPVRHPFSDSVLEMLNQNQQQEERKRSPSVYDTIRHMLEMERNEENHSLDANEGHMKSSMKKRIVSSEDSLTKQLSVLRKTH